MTANNDGEPEGDPRPPPAGGQPWLAPDPHADRSLSPAPRNPTRPSNPTYPTYPRDEGNPRTNKSPFRDEVIFVTDWCRIGLSEPGTGAAGRPGSGSPAPKKKPAGRPDPSAAAAALPDPEKAARAVPRPWPAHDRARRAHGPRSRDCRHRWRRARIRTPEGSSVRASAP